MPARSTVGAIGVRVARMVGALRGMIDRTALDRRVERLLVSVTEAEPPTVSEQNASSTAEEPASGGTGSPRFLTLAGGYCRACVLRLDARSPVHRAAQWSLFPFRSWSARRQLRRNGFARVACYCVFPSLEQPTFVYPSQSAAEVYAESYFLPHDRRPLTLLVKRVATWWLRCHPSIGAFIIVGVRT